MYAKSRKKKLWIPIAALLLAAALGCGIRFATRGGGEPVNVYPFQYIGMTEFWGDAQESYGPVTTDKIQTAFLSDTQTVTEVKVKDGDMVKKGDVLFSFDTTLDGLTLERKRLEVEKIKVQIQAAEERLQETREMVPYVPAPPKEPEESDLGKELTDSYEISDRISPNINVYDDVYDGRSKETALICWLKNDTPVDDELLEVLRKTALDYQSKNPQQPETEEENQETSNASDIPENPQDPPADNPPAPDVEEKYTVPGEFFCNNEPVTADVMVVGKEGYRIRSSYTYQNKTYWLESATPKNKEAVLEDLLIEPYPQETEEQAAWEAKWGAGITVKYIRDVPITGSQLKDGVFSEIEEADSLKLEVGKDSMLTFRTQMKNPPEGATLEKFVLSPADGILEATGDRDLLIVTGKPEEVTSQSETYTVTARYSFDDNHGTNRAVEETFTFSVSVVPRAEEQYFYVVFKVTEKNLQMGTQLVWQGARVTAYEDGSFGVTPYDAALGDHTLPAEAAPEIDLPSINPGEMYTAEQILDMQKQCYATIKEQTEKLKMVESEYTIMQRELGDGNVYAEIDGKVVSLLTEAEARQQKQPMIKVSGGGGFYIEGSVSELEKESLKLGQEVTVNDWSSGGTYTGEVVSIGDFPTENDNWNGMGNPTASYYPFKAFVTEDADLQAGSYVSMTYSTASAEQGIYLEKAFVRTEKGSSYIFVRGTDGRLEKRSVKLGKLLWGSYYEILSPLGEEDFLAFPYGKQVKEGAPTVESDLSVLYGY